MLEIRGATGQQIVDTDNLESVGDQATSKMAADESSRPGQQSPHGGQYDAAALFGRGTDRA